MNLSFCELRAKEIVNVINGQRLGKPADIIFCCQTAVISGIVIIGERRLFKNSEDIFIPWKDVVKIGDDVILVDFCISNEGGCHTNKKCDEN